MGISIDGQDLVFEGVVRLVNGTNPDTGVSYMILTPDGGTGSIPFLAQGLPGQPTLFDDITYVELGPDDTLPVPNPVKTLIDPGGSGVPARYGLKFYGRRGQVGATGQNEIGTAIDLEGVMDALTDKFGLIYDNSISKFVPTAQKVGNSYGPSSSINATAYNNASPRLLCAVNIPAQPFAWRPKVFAQTQVVGSAATRVDLVARINNEASGDQVGFAKGNAGPSPGTMTMIPAAPASSAIPGSYGRVEAGVSTTVYLRAEQKAATSGAWSTPASPDTTFWVDVDPLL